MAEQLKRKNRMKNATTNYEKYSLGELGDTYSKKANAKPEAFASKKFKQGELGGEGGSIGKKNKGQGLKAMGADDKSLSKSF